MSRPLSQQFSRAQFSRLKARKAEIARLREERGATDPILIIAGIAITLILLVGGSFAVSGFIANANDLNAKGDLDRIATAQAAYLASNDRYGALSVGPNVGTQNTQLQNASIGFTPTAGNSTIVRTSANGWVAVTKSASGKAYARSSTSTQAYEVPGVNVSSSYGAWTETKRNLALNPNMVPGGAGVAVQNPAGYNNYVVFTAGAGPNGVNAGELKVGTSNDSLGEFRMRFGGTGGNVATFSPAVSSVPFAIGFDLWFPASLAGKNILIEVPVVSSNGTDSYLNAFSFTAREGWQRIERNMTLTPRNGMVDIAAVQSPQLVTPYTRFSAGDTVSRVANLSFDTKQDAFTMFSGASTSDDPTISYAWTGAANSSSSVMRTRPATGTSSWGAGGAPSGFTLPAGITWAQVANDLQDVYS